MTRTNARAQVTKQSIARRVVDEHQIKRVFSESMLKDLYTYTPNPVSEDGKIILDDNDDDVLSDNKPPPRDKLLHNLMLVSSN